MVDALGKLCGLTATDTGHNSTAGVASMHSFLYQRSVLLLLYYYYPWSIITVLYRAEQITIYYLYSPELGNQLRDLPAAYITLVC